MKFLLGTSFALLGFCFFPSLANAGTYERIINEGQGLVTVVGQFKPQAEVWADLTQFQKLIPKPKLNFKETKIIDINELLEPGDQVAIQKMADVIADKFLKLAEFTVELRGISYRLATLEAQLKDSPEIFKKEIREPSKEAFRRKYAQLIRKFITLEAPETIALLACVTHTCVTEISKAQTELIEFGNRLQSKDVDQTIAIKSPLILFALTDFYNKVGKAISPEENQKNNLALQQEKEKFRLEQERIKKEEEDRKKILAEKVRIADDALKQNEVQGLELEKNLRSNTEKKITLLRLTQDVKEDRVQEGTLAKIEEERLQLEAELKRNKEAGPGLVQARAELDSSEPILIPIQPAMVDPQKPAPYVLGQTHKEVLLDLLKLNMEAVQATASPYTHLRELLGGKENLKKWKFHIGQIKFHHDLNWVNKLRRLKNIAIANPSKPVPQKYAAGLNGLQKTYANSHTLVCRFNTNWMALFYGKNINTSPSDTETNVYCASIHDGRVYQVDEYRGGLGIFGTGGWALIQIQTLPGSDPISPEGIWVGLEAGVGIGGGIRAGGMVGKKGSILTILNGKWGAGAYAGIGWIDIRPINNSHHYYNHPLN